MGGAVAVISDIMRHMYFSKYAYANNNITNFIIGKMLFIITYFMNRFRYLDKLFINSSATVTTGWGIVARK